MQRLHLLFAAMRQHPGFFLGTFFVTVFLTYAFLYIIDFYPEPIEEETSSEELATATVEVDAAPAAEELPETRVVTAPEAPLPTEITIPKLGKTITVLNPESRSVADLDAALLSGVVRHPDSADFSEPGNVFILGHSSYLPNVLNSNFQAFNGIQNLEWGDEIILTSATHQYTYRVKKVYKAKASEVVVPFTPGEARLTLATCDSFAGKDDRFIVEAELLVDETTTV